MWKDTCFRVKHIFLFQQNKGSSWGTLGHQRPRCLSTGVWLRPVWLHPPVTECRFLCYWMQVCVFDTQWGQTNMSEFGAKKRFIAGPSKENSGLVLKNPWTNMVNFSKVNSGFECTALLPFWFPGLVHVISKQLSPGEAEYDRVPAPKTLRAGRIGKTRNKAKGTSCAKV